MARSKRNKAASRWLLLGASALAGAAAWGLIVTGPDTANAGTAQLFDPAKQELQQPSLNLNNSFSPSLRSRAS